MISTLSNLADRNFILGFLLPVIVAGLVALALFQDIDLVAGIWLSVKDADEFAKLTVVVLSSWTVAVLLLAFNHGLYRLLEGYWGPFLRIGYFLERQRKAYDDAQENRKTLLAAAATSEKKRAEYVKATIEFRQKFPRNRDNVLPTRLGNVIRAFEVYSLDVYGIDSIPGWLRLCGVIPDSFSKLIENARAEVDFFVNSCLLFALVSFASLLAAVWMAFPFLRGSPLDASVWQHLAAGAATAAISYSNYHFAVMRAPAWGDLVRSAFDLYLPDLAKQLGYKIPDSPPERLAFWNALTGMFVFNEAIDAKYWPSDSNTSGPGRRRRHGRG